jgi:hypothetical protein
VIGAFDQHVSIKGCNLRWDVVPITRWLRWFQRAHVRHRLDQAIQHPYYRLEKTNELIVTTTPKQFKNISLWDHSYFFQNLVVQIYKTFYKNEPRAQQIVRKNRF